MLHLRGTTVYKARGKNKLFTEIFYPVNKMRDEQIKADSCKCFGGFFSIVVPSVLTLVVYVYAYFEMKKVGATNCVVTDNFF